MQRRLLRIALLWLLVASLVGATSSTAEECPLHSREQSRQDLKGTSTNPPPPDTNKSRIANLARWAFRVVSGEEKVFTTIDAGAWIHEGLSTNSSIVLLVTNGTQGASRDPNEAMITLTDGGTEPLAPLLPYWSHLTNLMENALQTQYPPVRLATMKDTALMAQHLAVYDLPSGRLELHPSLLQPLADMDLDWMKEAYGNITDASAKVVEAWRASGKSDTCSLLSRLATSAKQAWSQLHSSVWLCIACTILLANALPIAVNFILGDTYIAICEHLGHPAAQCQHGAIGFVIVASLLLLPVMAYGLFVICHLRTCGKANALLQAVVTHLGST